LAKGKSGSEPPTVHEYEECESGGCHTAGGGLEHLHGAPEGERAIAQEELAVLSVGVQHLDHLAFDLFSGTASLLVRCRCVMVRRVG
jgi:hypothetical protein